MASYLRIYPRTELPSQQRAGSLRISWLPFFFFLIVGCNSTAKLPPPPNSLPQPELAFGEIISGSEAGALSYKSLSVPGALVQEKISSSLSSEGVPPLRIEARAKGQWSGTHEKPSLTLDELNITPDNAPIGDEIRKQLEQGTPSQQLPLGVLSLLDTPAPQTPAPIRRDIKGDAATNNLKLKGTWVCTRSDGAHAEGAPARKLACVLENGEAIQEPSAETRKTERQAQLLGALTAVRSSARQQTQVSVEEIGLHLLAFSQSPRPTQIELRYQRKSCLNNDFCPILEH